jgi:hypothetical protein
VIPPPFPLADWATQLALCHESNAGLTWLCRSDTAADLYDTDGTTQLSYSDDSSMYGLHAFIEWTCPSTGTYVIGIRPFSGYESGQVALWMSVMVPEAPCEPNPCMNEGICHDIVYGYNCECYGEWTGTISAQYVCAPVQFCA